jgi:cobalamin synthase
LGLILRTILYDCFCFSHQAFHEDGFADVCDGFGGGWTKEKILMIMKDSAMARMVPWFNFVIAIEISRIDSIVGESYFYNL